MKKVINFCHKIICNRYRVFLRILIISSVIICYIVLARLISYKYEQSYLNYDTKLLLDEIEKSRASEYFIENDNELKQNNITVISMFFNLTKSKHSHEKYSKWFYNFARTIDQVPLILICDFKSFKTLKELRHGRPTYFYVIKSVWSLMKQLKQMTVRT
jgi:hypothetical protein